MTDTPSTWPPFISGKRVDLKPLRREDIHDFLLWLNDREVTSFLGLMRQRPMTYEAEMEYLEGALRQRPEDGVTLAIWHKKSDRIIGNMSFFNMVPVDQRAFVGLFIGEKKYWGKGLGTEALALMLDYGFSTLNLRKVCLTCLATNQRGLACYQKLGFQVAGRYQQQVFVAGQFVDEVLMEVFRNQFYTARQALGG